MAITPDQVATVATSLLIGSEVLALAPSKANSWAQLALGILKGIASTKSRR
jgi:hypothetical protein